VRSSGQGYDTIAGQGSARGDDGSGTCKTTGSARWPALKRRRVCAVARCGTAGNIQTTSSQGSVQPRLEGRVHNKVGGFSPLVPGHDGEAARWIRGRRPGLGLLREKQSSTTPSPAGPAPTPRWRLDHGRLLPSPGGSGSRANGIGIKAAGTRLDIVSAHVVRGPPQQPPGEEDGLTGFRGSGGLVASRCAAKEQGLGATRFPA
jgi:hypothetical protein